MQEANTLDRRNIRRQTRLLHVFVTILPAMSMVGQSYKYYYVTLNVTRKASHEGSIALWTRILKELKNPLSSLRKRRGLLPSPVQENRQSQAYQICAATSLTLIPA